MAQVYSKYTPTVFITSYKMYMFLDTNLLFCSNMKFYKDDKEECKTQSLILYRKVLPETFNI